MDADSFDADSFDADPFVADPFDADPFDADPFDADSFVEGQFVEGQFIEGQFVSDYELFPATYTTPSSYFDHCEYAEPEHFAEMVRVFVWLIALFKFDFFLSPAAPTLYSHRAHG